MGLRGPFGKKENKREKGKRGAATLVGHMGPTRAGIYNVRNDMHTP